MLRVAARMAALLALSVWLALGSAGAASGSPLEEAQELTKPHSVSCYL
jgi:hypothetical protein